MPGGCGGYWFDGGKATALGFQGAFTLDGAAGLNVVARAPHGDARRCPRCEQPMREISGGPLPEGLHLDQCGPCRGVWFDLGELLLYKSAIERRRRGVEPPMTPPAQPAPLGIVHSSARPGLSESMWEFMWDMAFAGIGGRLSGAPPPLPKFSGDPMTMTDRELGKAPRPRPRPQPGEPDG